MELTEPASSDRIFNCMLPDRIREAVYKVSECQDEAQRAADVKYTDVFGRFAHCDGTDQKKIMDEAGTKYVHRGAYRDVYEWDWCVVKVANSVQSREDNLLERDIWKYGPEKLKQFLVPVDDSDPKGRFVTMPYAKTMGKPPDGIPPDVFRRGRLELQAKLYLDGYECVDIHSENVGFLSGSPKLLDYGDNVINCRIDKLVTETAEYKMRKEGLK